MQRDEEAPRSLPRRLAWFVALWAGGVAVIGIVAWAIRLVIMP